MAIEAARVKKERDAKTALQTERDERRRRAVSNARHAREAVVTRPKSATIVKHEMDEANRVLMGALNCAAAELAGVDPSRLELASSEIVGDSGGEVTERRVKRTARAF